MRARTFLIGIMLVLGGNMARAQWVVTDPGNLAQSIINMSDNIAHTSKTAVNTADNFAETVKIYEQAKKYYDQLKAVNNLIQDARKVRDIILMVGDVSDIYVTNFKKMMNDDNFSSRELDAIAFGYTRLLEESNGVLQDLKQVINVSTLSMTDKDRMDVVDNCYYEMRRYRNLVSDEEFDRQLDELGWSTVDTASRLGMYVEVGMYNLEKKIRDTFRSLLELIFAAASLLIDTVRTFFLVVLSILGPVAFAFSVWDGFQSTLGQWFTRYISVYLWLPVSDLFSTLLAKLQVLMLQNDIQELQNNPDYSIDNSNSVYIIFMLIGIIGYFTVPTVAGWIVQAGGAGNFSRNLNRTATKTGSFAAGVGGAVLGNIGGRLRGK